MTIFTREGTVSRILPHRVEVTVISVSACLHCRLKENCTVSDCRSRNILVETDNPQRYAPGSRVTVLMDSRLGWWSVFYAYILPLILVLSSLFAILAATADETAAAAGALAVLVPYYLLLAAMKKRLLSRYAFRLKEE
ncbi:MAG: SoxR reducing system RseC family protein [Alphaproteobacteria bacterium]|jgi:sigma-E factor negative regulatory protein RseC